MTKPNKDNSNIRQALLDLKSAGGDADAIAILIHQIDNNKQLLQIIIIHRISRVCEMHKQLKAHDKFTPIGNSRKTRSIT